MAVLNVRIEDHVRDRLKDSAEEAGVSISEYVRDLIMERVQPVREKPGDQAPPESIRLADRQILALLHRILGRVIPEDDAHGEDGDLEYQVKRATILEQGFTREYWLEVAGMHSELSVADCDRVLDILDMFRVITGSFAYLEGEGAEISDDLKFKLEFRGFDHSDPLEGHMASYVEHLMADDRWTELAPQLARNDGGNSHSRMLDVYGRMLAEYRRIMNSRERGYSRLDYILQIEELERIAAARVHPSDR